MKSYKSQSIASILKSNYIDGVLQKSHPDSRVCPGFCGAHGHSGNQGNRCTPLDQNGQYTVAHRGRQNTHHSLQGKKVAFHQCKHKKTQEGISCASKVNLCATYLS